MSRSDLLDFLEKADEEAKKADEETQHEPESMPKPESWPKASGKARAKTKSKGKARAKGKAKSKATGQLGPLSGWKRPRSEEEDSVEEVQPEAKAQPEVDDSAQPKAKTKAKHKAKVKAKAGTKAATVAKECEPEEEVGETSGLRDRIKARKFHEIFDVLPDHIKHAWGEACKAKGTKRERQSEVINAAIERPCSGKLGVRTDHPMFEEAKRKIEQKFHKEQQAGVIEEEAAARCGSKPALEAAVQRGAVQVAESKGLKFYFFPSIKTGKFEASEDRYEASQQKPIKHEDFKCIGDLVRQMGWVIADATASCSSNVALEDTNPTETKAKLLDCLQHFEKTLKICEKLHEKLRTGPGMSEVTRDIHAKLEGKMVQGEELVSHLRVLVKFGKTKEGEALTPAAAQQHVVESSICIQALIDLHKMLKGQQGSKEEQDHSHAIQP